MILPNAPLRGPAPSRPNRCIGRYWQRALGAALLSGLAAGSAAGAEASRFPLGERGPFNALLGIPDGWTDLSGRRAELSWNIANHSVGERGGSEFLLLDGETHAVTLRMQQRLGERLSFGFELPWIAQSGGFLDPMIDSWHDAFGLSEGIRPSLPRNELQFVYGSGDSEQLRLDRNTSGLGDLHSAAVLRLAGAGNARNGLRLDLTADADWPTGDAARLTGNSGVDLAAGLRLSPGAASRFGWVLSAGVLWPGDVDLPLPPPSGRLLYYDVALAWAATQAVDLIIQVNGHSGAYQGGPDSLSGNTLQIGAGALWHFGSRYSLRFGVFEDLRTDTAPDFATELALLVRAGSRSRAADAL